MPYTEEVFMAVCCLCGNNYNKSFKISINNSSYDFDCFECAITKLAPVCQNCGCKIIGHGLEVKDSYYCCSHCVRNAEINANAKITTSP